MIKRIRGLAMAPAADAQWLDLASGVEVELTSEDPAYPIENALLLDRANGWRAASPGPQSITLIWSGPIRIRRIRLVFEEHSTARTQEFVVRASSGEGVRDIVRQQFTFAPPGTTVESEEYQTTVDGLTRLELEIIPAIDKAAVIASLKEWRIA